MLVEAVVGVRPPTTEKESLVNKHQRWLKATSTILPDNFKGLTYFENLLPKKIKSKTLLYGGLENQSRTIAAVKSWVSLSKL